MPRIEVLPTTKAHNAAPGWAYVLEPAIDPSKQPLMAAGGARGTKRAAARSAADIIAGTHNKTQAAKVQARLEELDRDNPGRWDVAVPEQLKRELAAGRWKGSAPKTTAAVRKVLGSDKTWVHYALEVTAELEGDAEGRGKKKKEIHTDVMNPEDDSEAMEDVQMESSSKHTANMTVEEKRLVQTNIPQLPSKTVLDRLTKAPPLTYAAAVASRSDAHIPLRKFCDICSYWGKMKCALCGSYVCGLACKVAHNAAEHPHR